MAKADIKEVAREMASLWPKLVRGVGTDALSRMQVSASQIMVLATLHDLKKCTVTSLAREKGVSAPTMSGLVDRLVKGGYLLRGRDKGDRRTVLVTLSKKGEAAVQQILALVRKRWMKIAVGLSATERDSYIRILRKISRIVSEEFKSGK